MQASSWTERYQMAGAAPRGDAIEAFRAVDANGRQLTIKVTRPRDPQRFFAHVATLARIDHPNVERVLDWGQDGDLCWIATEHVEGLDLQSVLSREQRLSPEATASAGQQAAAGLAALHSAAIVHGGISPHTLIRGYDGVVKLTDVGLRAAVAPIDMSHATPAAVAWYASPEEALGRPVLPASDQYALGLVLYELCTGRRPFDGPDAFAVAGLQANGMPQAPHALAPGVPAALEGVIKRALQKRPEQRYAGAEEMQRDLLALGGAPIAEPPTVMMPPIAPPHAATPLSPPAAAPLAPVPEPEVEEKRRSRTGLVIALVLVVLIAAAVAAWALGLFGGGGGVLVPDLVGKDLAQARATLSDAGLKVGDVGYADGSTAETPGVAVQKQAPKSGAEVEEGATVDLTMSADLVAVTDVVGQSEAVAVNMLTQAGLKLDRVQRRQSDKVEAGLVIEQAPQAGTRVPKGSTFTLVVSKGAAPATVPDVEGESQAAAETALEGAGYTVNVVEQPSDTVPAGIVIEQNPSAGVEAAKGSRVTIVVSTGPPVSPTSTPTPTDSPSPAG